MWTTLKVKTYSLSRVIGYSESSSIKQWERLRFSANINEHLLHIQKNYLELHFGLYFFIVNAQLPQFMRPKIFIVIGNN